MDAPDPEGWLSSPQRWDKLRAAAVDHAEATLETLQRNSGTSEGAGVQPSFASRTQQYARRKASAVKRRLAELRD